MKKSILAVFVCEVILGGGAAVWAQPAESFRVPRTASRGARLLFPFVTTQSGFETEIGISNTSLDAFGTVPEDGACTFTFYGSGAPPASTSATIPAGHQLSWKVSEGGTGIASAPGF